VVAHIARNADALGNLITWARTGVETPMYDSAEQRNADIEQGARRSPEMLRVDLDDANQRLAASVASLPEDAWWAEVTTRAGRTIPAAEVAWMRCREVWVHAVDLGSGMSFADLPEAFVARLIAELAETFTARPEVEGIDLVASDRGGAWTIGPRTADVVVVTGAAHDLLPWLLGRSSGSALTASPVLPALPRWL
jgi:maleylpyruvate isomerase